MKLRPALILAVAAALIIGEATGWQIGHAGRHTSTITRTQRTPVPGSIRCVVPIGAGSMGDCSPQPTGEAPPRSFRLASGSSSGFPQGVDISNNNGTVSFAYLRAHGIAFVVAKGEEDCLTDSQFAHNVADAHAHNMPLGIYDYFRPGFSATATGRCLANLAKYAIAHGVRLLPAVFDVESFTEGPVCGALHTAENTLRALIRGLAQVIYGSVGTYPGCSANGTLSWPADWLVSNPPALPGYGSHYTIWQWFGPRFASTTLAGMDRDKGAPGLLNLVYRKPAPPISLSTAKRHRDSLRRLLLQFGCRRRQAAHETLGRRCKAWFKAGHEVNVLIRKKGGR